MWGYLAFFIYFLSLVCIFAIFAIGLNISWGGAGLFNVALHGVMIIGAYSTAILTTQQVGMRIGGFGLPIFLGVIAAMIFGALSAILFIPFIRKIQSPNYFALGCLGIGEIVRLVALEETWLTMGPMGISNVPRPLLFLTDNRFIYNLIFLILVAVVLALVYYVAQKALTTPWGRVLRSIREDEKVAKAMGKNVFKYKLQTLMLTGAIIGLGAALLSQLYTYINPDHFEPFTTFIIWIMIIAGGVGNNLGAIFGAAIVRLAYEGTYFVTDYLPRGLQDRMGDVRFLLVGIFLIIIMLVRAQGVFPEKKRVSRFLPEKD